MKKLGKAHFKPDSDCVKGLEEKPGIADEVALGVTYNEIDDYLEGKQVNPEAQATIEKWWHKGQHKRHLPITVFDTFWE